jgi:hypothetical protein
MKYSKDSDVITQGESIDIPITVSDENGDALNLTGAGLTGYKLPNFVTFTDNGNGTGVFHGCKLKKLVTSKPVD